MCLFSCYYKTDVCCWLNWSYVHTNFFWKLLVLQRNQKGFLLNPVYNHLKGIFAYTSKKKGTRLKKTSNKEAAFFFSKKNLFKEWIKKLNKGKRKNDYEWMGQLWLTFFELYTVYIRIILFPCLLINLFKQRYISSVKS